jgi:hypothetical protein
LISFRYLSTYIRGTFAGAFDEQKNSPIPPEIPYASNAAGKRCTELKILYRVLF